MERLKLVNKLWWVLGVALCMVCACISCTQNTGKTLVQDETLKNVYESLFRSASSEENLAAALVGFEAEHPQDFQSKLDLAQLYFTKGEYVLSYQYLQRALALAEDFNVGDRLSGEEASTMELLYRLLSYLCLFRGDVVYAEDYGKQALVYAEAVAGAVAKGESGDVYLVPALYLMGQILYVNAEKENFSQPDRVQEALEYFDRAYSAIPTMISASHVLGYGKLLIQANRGQEAEQLVEDYFALGNLHLDTLAIGKIIYEGSGNQEKEGICEFLAAEALVGGISDEEIEGEIFDYEMVSENIGNKWLIEYEALKDFHNKAGNELISSDFFGKGFCEIAYKVAHGHETKSDLDGLLELEGYFVNFPSYYWLLWQLATRVLDQDEIESFIPALKKCIALNPKGIYAQYARKEIKQLLLNEDFSQNNQMDAVLDKVMF